MTTAKGTFTGCGSTFSINYTCTGPSCSLLNGFPDTTCTTSGSVLSCTNGVTCTTPSIYRSDFTYTQEHTLVSQTQNVDLGDCGKFILTSDGTPGGTNTEIISGGTSACSLNALNGTSPLPSGSPVPSLNGTSLATPSPAPPTPIQANAATSGRRRSTPGVFCFILMAIFFLVQGTVALSQPDNPLPTSKDLVSLPLPRGLNGPRTTSLQLHERSENPLIDFAGVVAGYLGSKANTATDPKTIQLFKDTFVAEMKSAMCSWGYSGLLVSKLLPRDLIAECTTILLTISWAEGPLGEFVAVLAAGTACNFAASYMMSHVTGLKDLQSLLDAICDHQANACATGHGTGIAKRDLLTDPNNCGLCGRVCPSGVCKNGACTSNTCSGKTCQTYGPCGPGSSCVCASTVEGTGFCVDGETPCDGLSTCTDSSHCGSGEVCAVSSCCGTNVCVGATFCGGSSTSPKLLFERDYVNATIGSLGTWVP